MRGFAHLLATLTLLPALLGVGWASQVAGAQAFITQASVVSSPGAQAAQRQEARAVPVGMAYIPAGSFTPLYALTEGPNKGPPPAISVDAFLLDVTPVTNQLYLDFVRSHPRWQRSRVARIFAERSYLAAWAGDESPGPDAPADRPVTNVSWFAAKAYCASRGKVLPTTVQWEYAAEASATDAHGEKDPAFLRQILEWYSRPNPEHLAAVGQGYRNLWGVGEMHGLVWEWTLDFNTALVTGESRGDSALERDLFCGSGAAGATNFRDYAAFMRFGYRSSLNANYAVANLGFRCAMAVN